MALAPQTSKIFDAVCKLNCIKDYVLIGGTALSLQLNTRLSEDLDFCKWKKLKSESNEIDFRTIKRELSAIGKIEHFDIIQENQLHILFEGVKISFYANQKLNPIIKILDYKDNLRIADVFSIGVMKLEVLARRSAFRDYYDIYCILESGCDLKEMINQSLKYSKHQLKTKSIINMLTGIERIKSESNFNLLSPKYDISPNELTSYFIDKLIHIEGNRK
ncbi:MAG: nucleotidyl transferase AbiEii/AbiGii toxin family protein [Paludibacter sp.]|nr:nucleotidyl transferase AbiEii/AbiGii toxin family protein [Paludibacter sp.]